MTDSSPLDLTLAHQAMFSVSDAACRLSDVMPETATTTDFGLRRTSRLSCWSRRSANCLSVMNE